MKFSQSVEFITALPISEIQAQQTSLATPNDLMELDTTGANDIEMDPVSAPLSDDDVQLSVEEDTSLNLEPEIEVLSYEV